MLDHARSQVEWQLQAKLLQEFPTDEYELLRGVKNESTSYYLETPGRSLLYALDDIGLYFPRMASDTPPRPSITNILVKFHEKELCEISRNYDSLGRTMHTRVSGVAIRVIERLLQNVRGVCLQCYSDFHEALAFGCEHDDDHELCMDAVKVEAK